LALGHIEAALVKVCWALGGQADGELPARAVKARVIFSCDVPPPCRCDKALVL
jgi:hypothetical protein